MAIKVVNKSTYKGSGSYVGRPSALGNPFQVKHYTREKAIETYRIWLNLQLADKFSPQTKFLNRLIEEYKLTGELTLICFCKPLDCHADYIKELILEKVKE